VSGDKAQGSWGPPGGSSASSHPPRRRWGPTGAGWGSRARRSGRGGNAAPRASAIEGGGRHGVKEVGDRTALILHVFFGNSGCSIHHRLFNKDGEKTEWHLFRVLGKMPLFFLFCSTNKHAGSKLRAGPNQRRIQGSPELRFEERQTQRTKERFPFGDN